MLYLYDPRYNIKRETTLEEVATISGVKKRSVSSYKSRGTRPGSIECYLIDENTTRKQRRIWYEQVTYEDEYWLPLLENNEYIISNYGRIKKGKRFVLPTEEKRGRIYVLLNTPESRKFTLAALVARQFIGERKPGMLVYHKNGIRWDNRAENLTYLTAHKVGKKVGPKSRSRAVVQYNPQTFEILGEFRSSREAGRATFMSHNAICRCCRGETSNASGLHFMYEEDYIAKFGEIGGEEYAG